jgi:HK97 family phage prohead protease
MTFVLSDESVNSHGTWVKTSGINLERFKKNPVMLWSHDSAFPPIGKWENIRVEGDKLLADAVFDEDDALAQAFKRKVESGLLKACSIGFYAKKFSSDMADIKPGQRFETIVEAELIECSLCSVGSNENAMVLMNDKGERLEMNERGFVALGMKLIENCNNIDNSMSEELTQLKADLQAKEDELVELRAFKQKAEDEAKMRLEEARKELIKNAINERKIDKSVEAVWLQLATDNFESTKLALEAMPSVDSIASRIKKTSASASGYDFAGKSFREIDKAGRLKELKAKDFELYKQLYKEEYGVDFNENR